MKKSEQKRILAIIPARGGSKRLARKNMLSLADMPLVAYSILAAQRSPMIDKLVVSTEDPQIKSIASSYCAEVIDRPLYLACDNVRNDAVVMDVISKLEKENHHYDVLILLQPTSPLRSANHITECLQHFTQGRWLSAMSMCEVKHHPAKALCMNKEGVTPYIDELVMEEQSQKLEKVYYQNGAIYVCNISDFKRNKRFYQPPCMPYLMNYYDSIDIDTLTDLHMAEFLLERGYENSILSKL